MLIYPDAFEAFATRSGSLRTDASRRTFQGIIRRLHRATPVPVESVTAVQLTEFCLAACVDGTPAAPASIKLKRTCLATFFGWLEYAKIVPTNPAGQLKFTVKVGHGNARQGHWLTEEEVGVMVRSCPNTEKGRRTRLILMLGFFTGLRLTEISNLRWDAFNRDYTTVRVLGKGAKWANVGLPDQLSDVLKLWRVEAPPEACFLPHMRKVMAWRDEQFDSDLDWSQPLGPQGLYKIIRDAGDEAGIKVAPHDMRRTFAGLLEEQGVPITVIRDAMRHAELGTTSRYLELNPARSAKFASTFKLNLGG